MIDILVPTFGRADRLAAVAENIHATTATDHRIVFVIERDDEASEAALGLVDGDHVALFNERARNYAGAVNHAYRHSDAEYLFTAADDLRFTPEWDRPLLEIAATRDFALVIGTNDLCNPYVQQGTHATHYLVDRRYLDEIGGTIDGGPGSFLCEEFGHNFTDTEFIGLAKTRGYFVPCMESVVEHLHWSLGKSEADATTAKENATYAADEALFEKRRKAWEAA